MAVQLDCHSSDQLNASDENAEETDFSLSLHNKECLNSKTTAMTLFSTMSQMVHPTFLLLLVMIKKTT
jgi:hypothetical protein